MTTESDTSEKPKESRKVTRRQFIAGTVGGVVVGAAIGAAAGSLAFPKTATEKPWLPAKWDYTADVVVLGSGLAGLSTAIAAHDAGANVLVLEKLDQAHEGGNSRVSGNIFAAPADATQGAAYIKALYAGVTPDDALINAFSAGLLENVSARARPPVPSFQREPRRRRPYQGYLQGIATRRSVAANLTARPGS